MLYIIKLFYCVIFFSLVSASETSNRKISLLSSLEENIENGVSESVNYLTRKLEKFNDEHLGDSILGSQYKYLKTKLQVGETSMPRRKIHSAMLPLVFQVGATSTWMLLTALLTAKSVAIGLILLVFKIAVSSAKVSAFFTAWKQKHHHDHSYHEHGHFRSLNLDDHSSYFPEWHKKEEHTTSVEWNNNPYHYKTLPPSYNNIGDAETFQPAYKHLPTSYDLSGDDTPSFDKLTTGHDTPDNVEVSIKKLVTNYDPSDDAKLLKNFYKTSYDTKLQFENIYNPSEEPKNSYDSPATSYNPSGNSDRAIKHLASGYDDTSEEAEPYGGYEYADEDDLKNDIANSNGARKSRATTESPPHKTNEPAASIVYPCTDCEWRVPLALQH